MRHPAQPRAKSLNVSGSTPAPSVEVVAADTIRRLPRQAPGAGPARVRVMNAGSNGGGPRSIAS